VCECEEALEAEDPLQRFRAHPCCCFAAAAELALRGAAGTKAGKKKEIAEVE
jgi:hypothetical protein